MITIIAQGAAVPAIASWVILAIIVAAICGIALIAIRAAGFAVPPWAIQILWIVIVAVVAILAIKFLLSAAL